jgi:hypothetical protein
VPLLTNHRKKKINMILKKLFIIKITRENKQ